MGGLAGTDPMTLGFAALAAIVAFAALQMLAAWLKGIVFKLALHHVLLAALGGFGTAYLGQFLPQEVVELVAQFLPI